MNVSKKSDYKMGDYFLLLCNLFPTLVEGNNIDRQSIWQNIN